MVFPYFIFLAAFFAATSAHSAGLKSFHLAEGRPGCWDDIRTAALSAKEVKSLPKDCQRLRTDYLQSLNWADQKPNDYLKKLNQSLTQAKGARPPYEAILFSVLSSSDQVTAGLEARARVERKMKLAFRYAEAALYRMQGNRCESKKEYLHPFYREVCTGRDSILSTSLTTLNQGSHHAGIRK